MDGLLRWRSIGRGMAARVTITLSGKGAISPHSTLHLSLFSPLNFFLAEKVERGKNMETPCFSDGKTVKSEGTDGTFVRRLDGL